MTTTQTTYDTQPLPEPVYHTKGEIERETLAVYGRYQSYGWSDGAAEGAAAEFYAYQIVRLELRKLEEARTGYRFGPLPGPVQDVDGFFEEGARIAERAIAEREAAEIEVVCAWCVPPRHLSGPVGAAPENVSHGICATCAEAFEPEAVRA